MRRSTPSGGLGTLAETLLGRVRTLNYRSIRYPGHRDIMKLLLHDLRLRERREMLRDILEAALPMTLRDLVVIYVVVDGTKHGVFLQESYTHKVYAREIGGIHRTAIQMTTAAGMCAVLDLLAAGQLPQHGFVRQEDIALAAFLSNRFGSVFEPGHSETDPSLSRTCFPQVRQTACAAAPNGRWANEPSEMSHLTSDSKCPEKILVSVMVSFATFRRGLCHAGNLIAGH